jgi:hypothetical protein
MPNANALFLAESIGLNDLVARDPLLVIPVYQRAFAWDEKHVYALIEDVLEGVQKHYGGLQNNEHMTYIGSVILTNADKSLRDLGIHRNGHQSWLVIDGQQRLTTISLLALSLAYRLSVVNSELVAGLLENDSTGSSSIGTLRDEVAKTIAELVDVVKLRAADTIVPRIIRLATDDTPTRFNSPLSHIIFTALDLYSKSTLHRHVAKDPVAHIGRNHERKRYQSLEKDIGNFIYSRKDSVFGNLPSFDLLKDKWQNTTQFLHKRIPAEAFKSSNLMPDQVASLENTYRLCVFSKYLLSRVAMTIVHGQSENLAYDVFDSLNTSGEPLNAYETFKPFVLRQLSQRTPEYASASASFQQIEAIAQAAKTIGKRQQLYGSTVILYSLAELGERVGKKLADQHSALRRCYDQSAHKQDSLDLLKSTIQVATAFEEPEAGLRQGQLLPSLDEEAKVCFKFLSDIKHSLSLPPIILTFDDFLKGKQSQADLSNAVKAVTAFAVLWRAPRGGTAGIDAEFRNLMERGVADHGVGPLARSKKSDQFTVDRLKYALCERLISAKDEVRYGSLRSKEQWVKRVSQQGLYDTNKKLTKLILLAAQHDAAPDTAAPGLIVAATPGFAPSFTFAMYNSEQAASIEHVAPQNDRAQNGWSNSFDSATDSVHRLGNLLLMPLNPNSMLHSRSWDVKKKIYRALSRPTPNERQQLLVDPALGFLHSSSQQQILEAPYMAPLDAVARIDGEWDLDFVNRRSERMLELAYDRFYGWLRTD